jgi:hypothetical protein
MTNVPENRNEQRRLSGFPGTVTPSKTGGRRNLAAFLRLLGRGVAFTARGKVNHGIPRTFSDFLKKNFFCTCILDFCSYIKLVNDN